MSTLARRDSLSPTALGLAVLLHVGVLLGLVVMGKLHRLPEPPEPKVIQTYIAPAAETRPAPMPPAAPEPLAPAEPVPPPPQPEPAKPLPKTAPEPKPAPAPKVEPPKPAPVAKAPEPVAPKPAPVAPPKPKPLQPLMSADQEAAEIEAQAAAATVEAERLRRQQQAAAALAAERQAADQQARQARASQAAGIIAQYKDAIYKRIYNKWTLPSCAESGMFVELRLTLLPDGEVSNVIITKPSNCIDVDRSAKEAVARASPLKVPDDPVLFNESFRNFVIRLRVIK